MPDPIIVVKPDGERIAVLETHIELLIKQLTEVQKDVSEMKEILQKAKGAKWVVVTGASIAGAIAAYLPWLARYLGILQSG